MQNQSSRIENNTERQSCFELLRLLSMFCIVLYHFLRWFVQDNPSHSELKTLWLPLHVGVICFVLISGYFRIKPSSRGFIKLIAMVLVYSLPWMIVGIKNASSWHDVLHSFMFISRTDYWFVRTYIGLYLISPLVNVYFDRSSIKGKWYMLLVTGLVSIYLGNFTKYNLYLDGKNLVNFVFLYQIGQLLFLYSNRWRSFKLWKLLLVYVSQNLFLVVGYYFSIDTVSEDYIWRLSFPYNSPLLIVNSILLFIIVNHRSFNSKLVNHLAEGAFAIYLIHGSVPLALDFQRDIVSDVFAFTGNYGASVALLVAMALAVMLLCLVINQLLSPIWMLSRRFGNWAYNKLGF